VRAEIFEQPGQDQLRVRIGVNPDIDRIERPTQIGYASPAISFADIPSVNAPQPIVLRQRLGNLDVRRQGFPEEEALSERQHRIGDPGLPEASSSGVAGGQDQTLHIITITR
jgi:hypothetical protein